MKSIDNSSWLSLNPTPYATSLTPRILHCVTISNVYALTGWHMDAGCGGERRRSRLPFDNLSGSTVELSVQKQPTRKHFERLRQYKASCSVKCSNLHLDWERKKINYFKERAYEECGDKAMLSPLPPAFISTVMELRLCEKTSVLKSSLFRKQRKKTKIIRNLVMDNNTKH